MSDSHKGTCFCGAVEVTVTGKPIAMGYCHCTSCRSWAAAPVNAFILWRPEAVTVTKGAENLGTFNKTPHSFRKWCKTCGGHVLTEHPKSKMVDVYAAVLADYPFEAERHVHYGETKLRMRDGLLKLRDLPKQAGGSGDIDPE